MKSEKSKNKICYFWKTFLIEQVGFVYELYKNEKYIGELYESADPEVTPVFTIYGKNISDKSFEMIKFHFKNNKQIKSLQKEVITFLEKHNFLN